MYKIREAKNEDYSFINRLIQDKNSMQLGMDNSILDKILYVDSLQRNDAKWYLVEKSDEVKAFIHFTIDFKHRVVQVERFTIDAAYTKKGLNEHLYKKLEQFAERQQMHVMRIEIADDQDEVIDFFERKGWMRDNSIYIKYLN